MTQSESLPRRRTAGWFQPPVSFQRNPIERRDGHSATVIATTPSVVPAPSTTFSIVVIWSTEGAAEPRSIA